MRRSRRHVIAVLCILLIAALFRAWLILIDGVSFDSDEAVVGLMARHINQGKPIPTFFYGQNYMGSLDAILVAGGFRLLGESVHTIRAVQLVLYLLSLLTGYLLASTVTGSRRVAAIALLLLAIPTALSTLYTTLTLGGYNEIILLGNLVLLWGWQVTVVGRREAWRWLLLGLAAGLGWWSNGAIITMILLAGLMGLHYFSARCWRGYAWAAAGFLIGSAPWWVFNLRHDWAALDFLTSGYQSGGEAMTRSETLVALLALGLPTLYGLRFPWEPGFTLTAAVLAGALIYLLLVVDEIAAWWGTRTIRTPQRWVALNFAVFGAVFVLSSFSDATGRYLMPVWIPAVIGLALGLDRLRRAGWALPALMLGGLLVMHAGSVIRAAHTDTGLTPQLVERLRTPAADDRALLEFLREEGYTRGYASYWTSYRVMFRAHEALIFDTSLPHDERGARPGHNRYPPYQAQVKTAARAVWITQNFPALDTLIAARLDERQITFKVKEIGRYRVYYGFSTHTKPADVGLNAALPLVKLAADDP